MHATITDLVQLAAGLADPDLPLVDEVQGRLRYENLLTKSANVIAAVRTVREQIDKLYTMEGQGTSRAVYRSSDCVYKCPIEHYSGAVFNCMTNLVEALTYTSNHERAFPVVPCRIVWHELGVPIIVMERVEVYYASGNEPGWAEQVDSNQVAYSPLLGSWGAYDAGYAPSSFRGDDSTEDWDTTTKRWYAELVREHAEAASVDLAA